VSGVGYEVQVATSDQFRSGEPLELFIYTVVRADAIVLYGFKSYADREFFELLLVTPGVGPSTALAALRTMATDELALASRAVTPSVSARFPGSGPRPPVASCLNSRARSGSSGSTRPPSRRRFVPASLRTPCARSATAPRDPPGPGRRGTARR